MPEQYPSVNGTNPVSTDPLINRFFLSPQQKKDKDKGKEIIKAFYRQQSNGDGLSFFRQRNLRQIELLLWAKGSQQMKEFLDYMNVSDANKAWVNVDMTPSRIAPQFVGTLVESMAKNKVYACVTAIDDGSMNEKETRLFDALFRMHDQDAINDIQQKSDVQVEPVNAYIPADENTAKIYFELEDRLPKEIRFEKFLSKVQNDIKFERVANRKTLYDFIVLNSGFTKIEKCAPREYTVRKCIATNMVYNFFINDSGEIEITEIGEFYNLKVKDFRKKFGKSQDRPDGLSEKEIFELARMSTNKSVGVFNYMWNDNWAQYTFNYNYNRPYDDCSILVIDCEINCGEDVYYVEKPDAFGKKTISKKNSIPYQQIKKDGTIIEQEKPEDVEIIKRQKNSWMRGVYAPYGDMILYWGETDIIITPYTNVAKPLSSYSVNIPFNDGEYVPSLFERGIEVLREIQLTKLKRKQLIAKIKPSGIRIDVESARNLDLGNGDTIPWEEVVKIYDQTGNELWSSRGVDPLQRESPPLSNTVQDESIQKVIGLTQVLEGMKQELRQLWGVPMYRDGSDVGDRTAAQLAEGQTKSSYNVTDFITNANNQLWEETFYKLCLLHWNDVVKEEPESENDMLNTRFDVRIQMKSTEYEKQLIEQDIQRYSQVVDGNGNPALSPKDAMMIRNIENYKLACQYLSNTVEENRKKAIEDSERLQAQNAQVQQQSAQQAAEQAAQLQQQKLQADKEIAEYAALQQMKVQIVAGSFQIAAKLENPEMPAWLIPVIQQLVPNLIIPVQEENKQMVQVIQQQEHQEQQEAIQQQQMQEALSKMTPEQQQEAMAQMQQGQMQ